MLGLLCLALFHCVTAQPTRQREGTKELTAAQIADRALPAVGLVVCDDGRNAVQGSGFHLGAGVVVTNYHVISHCSRGVVQFSVESKKKVLTIAHVFSYDEQADVALLGVPDAAQAIPSLDYEDKNVANKIGETIYALGNPEGLTGTISQGIISAEMRSTSKTSRIQISAPISPGSSGGPVVNTRGKVIGVAVSSLRGGQNLNFAVPVFLLRELGQVTDIKDLELQEGLKQVAGKYSRLWKWGIARSIAFPELVDCGRFLLDASAGQISGIPINAEISEIGRRARCYTAISAEGLYGDTVNFGGGIFFGRHRLYFYTKADVIEARSGFSGFIIPINPLERSREFAEFYFGMPNRVIRRSNSVGEDAIFLQYERSYGFLTFEFVDDVCTSVYVSKEIWPR